MRTAQLQADLTGRFDPVEVDPQLPIELGGQSMFDDFVGHGGKMREHEGGPTSAYRSVRRTLNKRRCQQLLTR